MAGERARLPGDTGETLSEGGSSLRNPTRTGEVGEQPGPGGAVFGRCRENDASAAAPGRLDPSRGEAREEIRALGVETLLPSLSSGGARKQDQVPVHFLLSYVSAGAADLPLPIPLPRGERVG